MTSKSQKLMHAFFKATLGKPQNFDADRLGVAEVLVHLIDEYATYSNGNHTINTKHLSDIIRELKNENQI
jgi:hypothetical protein